MNNLVIYRKYRPKIFAELVGQEHVVQTITNAIVGNLVSHAYLFTGQRGSGKTTIARLLAKSVNCQNRKANSFEPCNECSSCLEIMNGRAMDIVEIDAASHRGIDDIRELREGIKFAPSKSKYKVFIIDECHQLSKDAVNALLKTLEEPPSHAIFVLATTELHKMIPTIISRCQRFDFRKLTIAEIIKRLESIVAQENVKIDQSALELIALNSGGSIRDAESLLDQVLSFSVGTGEIKGDDIKNLLGLVEIELVSQLTDFVFKKDAKSAVNLLDEIVSRGLDVSEFGKSLLNYLRQALVMKITSDTDADNSIITGLTKDQFEKLKEQVLQVSETEISNIIEEFLEAANKMKYSPIAQLPFELAIVNICVK